MGDETYGTPVVELPLCPLHGRHVVTASDSITFTVRGKKHLWLTSLMAAAMRLLSKMTNTRNFLYLSCIQWNFVKMLSTGKTRMTGLPYA